MRVLDGLAAGRADALRIVDRGLVAFDDAEGDLVLQVPLPVR